MHGAMNVSQAPIHDLAKLLPIVHLLKRHHFYRCARNDHTVVILVLDIGKGLVKRQKMLLGGILRKMGLGAYQRQLDLQGGVSEKTGKLRFCLDFLGHKGKQHNTKRTNILRNGTRLGHCENVLVRKRLHRGEIVGNFNRHIAPLRP